MGKTAIEWTERTWTPIRARVKQNAGEIAAAKQWSSLVQIATAMAGRVGPHCERVSPGCEHCYSETNNSRCLPFNGTGLPFDRRARELVDVFLDEKILHEPLGWKQPQNVFVCSQTDLFGEWVPDEVIDRVFAVMALCPQHTFQVLTKRADRMLQYFTLRRDSGMSCGTNDDVCDGTAWHVWHQSADFQRKAKRPLPCSFHWSGENREGVQPWPLPNVWLGVSVEDQQRADERIPLLLETPAAVRWISAEPLLGPVDLTRVPHPIKGACPLTGIYGKHGDGPYCSDQFIQWVVVGGESGPGARPMHPDWVRSLRDQCAAAKVPFFFKQWGAWQAEIRPGTEVVMSSLRANQCVAAGDMKTNHTLYTRVGKKGAGRLLDGVLHNEYPRSAPISEVTE